MMSKFSLGVVLSINARDTLNGDIMASMANNRTSLQAFRFSAACTALIACGLLAHPLQAGAQAISISGSRPSEAAATVTVHAIAGTETFSELSTSSSERRKFSLRVRKGSYLGFLNESDQYVPALLAVKKGAKFYTPAAAIRRGICTDGNALGLNVIQKAVTNARFRLNDKFAYLSRLTTANGQSMESTLKRIVKKSSTVTLGEDCAPSGNAENGGVTIRPGVTAVANLISAQAIARGDSDEDGIPDLFDSDVDADGILNPYDSGNIPHFAQFYVFSNIKADISQTVNSNVGATPTREEVDNLLSSLSQLAVEVKGDPTSGDVSELACGSLPYCSAGGTGTVDTVAFPGSPGSDLDQDSDGKGELTAGSTGDVQLKTNAELPDINTGDTFVQSVTPTTGRTQFYFRRLDFVFKSTPALESVTLNPGTDTESVTTISYPTSSGMAGSATNCLDFANPSDDSQVVRITAWRPQRKGIEVLGEGEFVDIGGSEITIDIPNPPCIGGVCDETRTPNNCNLSTYTETDDNLSTETGKLLDTRGDADADASEIITFDLDLKACLLESSDSLDVGETVALDLQFRSKESTNGYDNSAVKFCITRSS